MELQNAHSHSTTQTTVQAVQQALHRTTQQVLKRKFINVGEIYVSKEPMEIATVLGSCVGIALYDRVEKIGALNHYLLPLWNGNGLQSPKFGNISIPKMIEQALRAGASIQNMEAKIFGGANINQTNLENMMIGKKNIIIAREILAQNKIPVVAEDVGGFRGRRIVMRSDTNKVLLRYAGEEDKK
ncbi:MAG: chemotaxis protein CheD [Helicobacteraceae bacterium]|nr:chemotaxis protein CheD [Helicobacteraceae bacterium]